MADRDDEIDRRSSYFNTNTSNADRASTTATSVQEEDEPVSPKSSAAAPTVSSAGLREDDGLQLKELEHDDDASIHVADKIQNLKVDNGDSSTDDGDLESGKTKVHDASVSVSF